ncbi:MAG TPA: hypothetical protein PLS49_06755 [Candidatus Woesebacteria bacterium]|nr:hypothetical protein [Candidatus Woesebacteria bacterium]
MSNQKQEHLDEEEARLDQCLIHGLDHQFYTSYLTRTVDGKEYEIFVCDCGTEALEPVRSENRPRPI